MGCITIRVSGWVTRSSRTRRLIPPADAGGTDFTFFLKLETQNLELKIDIEERARRVRVLLMDCDGVLTDGRIWLTADGEEQKAFHVRDGQGIALFHAAGLKTGVISGRTSLALERRAAELGISFIRQNVEDKVASMQEILAELSISPNECAYIGDDLADIPVMKRVGLAFAVADAADEAKQAAHSTTTRNGGHGAVADVCCLILKAQGRWDEVISRFLT